MPLLLATQEAGAGGPFDQPGHHREALSLNQSIIGGTKDGVAMAPLPVTAVTAGNRWAELPSLLHSSLGVLRDLRPGPQEAAGNSMA